MKTVETNVKITNKKDDLELTLKKYDVATFSELENDLVFGIVTNPVNIQYIIPNYEFVDYEMKCGVIRINAKSQGNGFFENDIPLIFKKIDDSHAKEILTGEIFRVMTCYDEVNGIYDACTVYDKYANDNSLIVANLMEVNDRYKVLYAEMAMPYKEEIIKDIHSIKETGKIRFKDSYDKILTKISDIADIENTLYDLEHPKLTLNKK
jgi:hypothetical protein